MESITLQTGDNIITSGEILGKLQFAASAENDANGRLISASLSAQAEGAFTSAGNPCSLIFSTSSNDTNPASGRLKVSEDGHFIPMLDASYDLGSLSNRFRNAFISEGVVLSSNTPSSTTNKLYSTGGTLYFDGSAVGGGSYTAGSGLILAGNQFNVWGGSGHFRDLDIENVSSTNIPLIVKGAAAQSANLQEWRNNSDSIVAAISSSGNLTTRDIIIGNNDSFKATLQYTGNSTNRTYTFPNPGFPATGNLNVAFINASQVFDQTTGFTGRLSVRRGKSSDSGTGVGLDFAPTAGTEIRAQFTTTTESRTLSWLDNQTASGVTKTFDICPSGLAGSITNINMGSAVPGAITNISISGNITHSGVIITDGITSDYYRTDASMIITESGTSRTLTVNDNGRIIMCTSASATTITVGTAVGTAGFSVTAIQASGGQITFSPSSTTINNRQGHTKTAGQWAVVSLLCRTTNNFVLTGDTAA